MVVRFEKFTGRKIVSFFAFFFSSGPFREALTPYRACL